MDKWWKKLFPSVWKTTRTLELERELYSNHGGHRWTDLFIGGQAGNSSMPCIEPERSVILDWI